MAVIIGEKPTVNKSFHLKRLINCPGHYLIPPQIDIYLREPIPEFKNCSKWVEVCGKRINIKKTRIAKDKWGNKLIDWKKLFALRKQGIVIHPKVSAAWAIENVYDPKSYLCLHCRKECKDGQGIVNEMTIKRLHK